MRHIEDELQKSCIRWFDYKYPKLKLRLHHSPNGGKRNLIEAAKFKEMGVRAGFPDLIFLVPNKQYPFMGIELKTSKGKLSEYQKEYQREFVQMGARYVVCRSVDEFMNEIDDYISNI